MSADLLLPKKLLLDEMAARLGLSAEEVLRKERACELFSYVKPRQSNARLYPVYQLAPEIYPDLLRRATNALTANGPLLDTYFSARDPDMAGLCVRELLAGRAFNGSHPDNEATWLLSLPAPRRLEAVLGALDRLVADAHRW